MMVNFNCCLLKKLIWFHYETDELYIFRLNLKIEPYMKYNFDEVIERRGTDSVKYDAVSEYKKH